LAGESPYEAFDNFRSPLQRAISCVNREAHLWALGSNGYAPGQTHALTPDAGEPVDLAGEPRFRLAFLFTYRIEKAEGEHGPWKVTTKAYFHALETEDGQEIIAYHWHPEQGSAYNFPHLHIGAGVGASLGDIHKYHFPTGRIALEDVLRLAIKEFGVVPWRSDWEEVLEQTQSIYEARRTWHGSIPAGAPEPSP
jgi:hypothetical protein